MTLLEFWGCALITFGPALAMFWYTVAHDPIRIILLISSSFFWLMSFLLVSMCWAIISPICDYLIIAAYLAVLSQECFRFLFHLATKRAQVVITKLIAADKAQQTRRKNPSRADEIQLSDISCEFRDRIPLSYVSGLGFGLMNASFSIMNVLTDYIGPGSLGLRGDSVHFLLVSSLTALAFIYLNVSWSMIMSESIEKPDKRLAFIVLGTHLVATTITFVNRLHLQLISLIVIYLLTALCGIGALQVAGLNVRQMISMRRVWCVGSEATWGLPKLTNWNKIPRGHEFHVNMRGLIRFPQSKK